jgi:hypothetical protein
MTSDDAAGGRILGRVRSANGTGIVRTEGRFDMSIDDVWSALTDEVLAAELSELSLSGATRRPGLVGGETRPPRNS